MFYLVIMIIGVVVWALVFLTLGLVALLRCEKKDLPKVVQALHFEKLRK